MPALEIPAATQNRRASPSTPPKQNESPTACAASRRVAHASRARTTMGEHLAVYPALASVPADHPGAAALKGLLDNGIPIEDPRCQTLIGLLTTGAAPAPAPPISDRRPAPSMLALHRFSNASDADTSGPQASASDLPSSNAPRLDRCTLPLPRLPEPSFKPVRNVDRFAPTRPFGAPSLFAYTAPPPPQRAYYTPLHWPTQPESNTTMQYVPPTAQQLRFPLQPANIHASYAPHLVAQPVLSHAPNHAFSFEDNQRAILSRRLVLEDDAAAAFSQSAASPKRTQSKYLEGRYSPTQAVPSRYSVQPVTSDGSILDPSKYFSETYSSPTSQRAPHPPAPSDRLSALSETPAAQASRSSLQGSKKASHAQFDARENSEQQVQALDLLSLHMRTSDQANNAGPRETPNGTANMGKVGSDKTLLGGSALRTNAAESSRLGASRRIPPLSSLRPHNSRPRSGLEHLLTREDITPTAQNRVADDSMLNKEIACGAARNTGELGQPNGPSLDESKTVMVVTSNETGTEHRIGQQSVGLPTGKHSFVEVSQSDSVFRAALLAQSHEQARSNEQVATLENSNSINSKPRKIKNSNSHRKPRKSKDPISKEKRPRKSKKKQMDSQQEAGSGIQKIDENINLMQASTDAPHASPEIAERSEKNVKQPKRKRRSKKTTNAPANESSVPVTEEVLENGNVSSVAMRQQQSGRAVDLQQTHRNADPRSDHVKINGALSNPRMEQPREESGAKPAKVKKKRRRKKKSEDDNVPNGTPAQKNLQKRVGGVAANHLFQLKAQVDALRKVSRGMEPPTEVTVASGGLQPMSEVTVNGLIIPSDLLRKGAYQEDSQSSARKLLKPTMAPVATKETENLKVAAKVRPERPNERLFMDRKETLEALARMRKDKNGFSPGTVMPQEMFPQSFPNGVISGVAQNPMPKSGAALDSSVLTSLSSNSDGVTLQNVGFVNGPRSLMSNVRNSAPVNLSIAPGTTSASKPGQLPTALPNGVPLPQKKAAKSKAPRKSKKTVDLSASGVRKRSSAKNSARKAASASLTISGPQYNGRTFRELLFDREQRIKFRVRQRLHELNQLPDEIPEEIRVQAIIEKKKLNLLSLQRSARAEVTGCMQALFARGSSALVGESSINRFRRPTPSHWSWRQPGGAVKSTAGTLTEAARRNVQILEQKHRAEQEARRRQRQASFMEKQVVHYDQVRSHQGTRQGLQKKLMKDLERYFKDKVREEERRKRKETQERLRALRENNEEEYIKLLKNTKNSRLLQLLKQTDEYLQQIGAKVEQQKQAARQEEPERSSTAANGDEDPSGAADGGSTERDKTGSDDDDDLQAMRQRRNEYYTVTHAVKEKVYQPKSLIGGKLKHYQVEGLEWLVSLFNNNLNGILADEMGLGKTIQTLSLITYLFEVKGVSGPYLIIVPLSTMSNWVRELERWAPSLTKVVYRGDPATRRGIQAREMAGREYNVLLTTYEFIVRDKGVLGKVKWKYIIIDEGHRMKNSDCKLALTLGSKYTSRNRLLLTGTPLQNNLTELWALLNFLLPSIFANSDTFETWFNAPFQAQSLGGSQELDEEENLLVISRLHQVLRPFMLRRLKTDVECQLPDKVEEVVKCKMSAWQQVLYRQMRDRLGIAAGGASGSTKAFNNIVMQLKKVCNHPYLFYTEDDLAGLPRDNLIRASGKFELLCHFLLKLKRTGHRVLMFSQMTAALDYLGHFLYNIGIKFLRLDGTTKAEDRQSMLETFNAKDSPYFCFLLSTRAGGLGLNLQTADTVIIFDSDWNPMMDLQAQDRAHRIGQTKEVRVFRLICAETIEVSILERANRKLRMDAQVIQAGQFNNKSSDIDRKEMLKDILRSKDDEEELTNASSLDSINRMLARSDEELEIFEEMDRERLEEANALGRPPLMVDESEVPKWVFMPEAEQKSKEQLEAEYIEQHGRGQRKRKKVSYADALTEEEWTEAVEEDGDIEGAVVRKRRRLSQSHESTAEKSVSSKESSPPSESVSMARNADSSVPDTMEENSGKPPLPKKRGRGRPRKHLR